MASEFSLGTPNNSPQGEVEDFFQKKFYQRRPHERQWYVTRAFERGQQFVAWSEADQTLATPDAPVYRVRLAINRILSKIRARAAKFLKNRAMPTVVPATNEIQDRMNARFSTKALAYEWRRARLEQKYQQALNWCNTTGHGYWWFHWDEKALGRMVMPGGAPNTPSQVEVAPIGDIYVEVVDPFQIVVDDPAIAYIGDQPRIGRIRLMPIDSVKANPRWASITKAIGGESKSQEAFMFRDRIGLLTSNTIGIGTSSSAQDMAHPEMCVLLELYEKPCAKYPKGRYRVQTSGILLEDQQELPHGFADLGNPYPCVDFFDFPQAGQYWITTIAEQMVNLQREYNLIRSKLAEHIRLLVHPKILVAKQHQLAAGAWTSDSGEIVEYVALPGIPPPQPWIPPPISQDTYRVLELLAKEFDEVSQIYPEAQGRVGNATSGFQTNLLQEATDQVHEPDIRAHEIIIEEAGIKLRRMMKTYFSETRLLTVSGRNLQPEVFEFSADQIDDFADIVVEADSALPTLKAAKIQMISDLWKAGLLGNPQNPEDVRRVRSMLEMGTLEDQYDSDRADEELARLETAQFDDGKDVPRPDAFQNHEIHYRTHTDDLKSAASQQQPLQIRMRKIAHVILHVRYINPQSAVMLAQEYNMPALVQDIVGQMTAAQQATGGQPAPAGAPAQAPAAPTPGAPSPTTPTP